VSLLSRLRRHKALRLGSFALMVAVSILAAAIVATLTIDLGPRVREYAEDIGSKQLKRPIHINRLEIHLLRGRVVVNIADVHFNACRGKGQCDRSPHYTGANDHCRSEHPAPPSAFHATATKANSVPRLHIG